MSWNYRIVHQFSYDDEWDDYAIHEVYYDKNGKPDGMTEECVSPTGRDQETFLSSWDLYQVAFKKEILYFDCDNDNFVEEKTE